jgi:hypothetical protein
MGQVRELEITRWAAILADAEGGGHLCVGTVAEETQIPAGLRRRMGRLERLAIRCALGVLGDAPKGELIFCSRHGNVETLAGLLNSIARREPLSPMSFSGSVHNATPGLVGQVLNQRLSHTALSAGRRTFSAALIEAYCRLATDVTEQVTIVYADLALPDLYREFEDEQHPGVVTALRVELASANEAKVISERYDPESGRRGVFELLESVRAGAHRIALEVN